MRRGTTPTHTMTLPFNTDTIDKIRILYSQKDELILTKNTEDCTISGNIVTVSLTQEDTLLFKNDIIIEIQVRILFKDGTAAASDIFKTKADKLLEDEVLV
jgi:hypothetical protein